MEFKKVDYLPGRPNGKGYALCKLEAELVRFKDSNIKVAKVTGWEGNYKTIRTAAESIRTCAKRFKLPVVPAQRKGELYIIRTDM